MADWGPEKVVTTDGGVDRILRTARDKPELASTFSKYANELSAHGVYRHRNPSTGKFRLLWFLDLTPSQIAERKASFERSLAIDSDLEIPAPDGITFRPYQRGGIDFAVQKDGCLIADSPGLGKTPQAIGVINVCEKIHRVLVICPNIVKRNWVNEIFRFSTRDLSVSIATSKVFPGSDIVIINYDILWKWRKKLEYYWDLIILDECAYLKNPKAKRTKAVLGYYPVAGDVAKGNEKISALVAKKKIALSGTPMANGDPSEMFGLLRWLDPVNWRSKTEFMAAFCGKRYDPSLGKYVGVPNHAALQSKLRETVMIRRLKRDVAKEMPPKIRQVVEVDASSLVAASKELRRFQAYEHRLARLRALLELSKTKGSEVYRQALAEFRKGMRVAFEEMGEIRRDAAIAKVPIGIDYCREMVDSGCKSIVFAHHRRALEMLHAAFPDNSELIYGGMDNRDRKIDRFNNDPACRILFSAITIAIGWNANAADTIVFFEGDWVPATISQAEDRGHRLGKVGALSVVHLVIAGSFDARLAARVIEKQAVIEACLDPDSESASDPIIPIQDIPPVPIEPMRRAAEAIAGWMPGFITGLSRDLLEHAADAINPVDRIIIEELKAQGREFHPVESVLAAQILFRYPSIIPVASLDGIRRLRLEPDGIKPTDVAGIERMIRDSGDRHPIRPVPEPMPSGAQQIEILF